MEKINFTGQQKTEESQSYFLIRHLKDIDDLRDARDSDVEDGQEKLVERVANDIYSDFSKTDNKSIFLSVSNKKRTLKTADSVKKKIEEKFKIKIFVNLDSDLSDLDHGEYDLPENYEVGVFFQPFEDAWKIFTQETFEKGNIDYRFGDSKNGEYKSIENIWIKFGESYREIFLRLLKSIIDLSSNQNRFVEAKIKPYVITHSLPFGVFRSLYGLSQEMKNGNFQIGAGNLIFECWKYYNSGKLSHSNYGQICEFPMDVIQDSKMMDVIKSEVEFLKRNER